MTDLISEIRARCEAATLCLTCGGVGWYVKRLHNGVEERRCEKCRERELDLPRCLDALEIAIAALRVVPDDQDHLAQQALAAIEAALRGQE